MTRVVCLAFLSLNLYAQTPATPQFDVASIRPSATASSTSSGGKTGHGQVLMTNMTLKRLIMGAYAIGPNQLFGGPDWLDSDRFDIRAKSESAGDDDAVLMKMMQSLLAERFKLAAHRDTKTVQAYVLEVAKNGPKMHKSEGGESNTHGSGRYKLEAKATDMKLFSQILSRDMDLPVVDATGLEGGFDFTLEWTKDGGKSGGDAPSIFTALQEQLGLRLRAQKMPVEVLVIDHAEKPTEN